MTDLAPIETPTALAELHQVIARLDEQRQALTDAGQLDALALGLAQLRGLMADLRDLGQLVEADVANMMPGKTWEIDGLGTLERRAGTVRKSWDWEQLLPRLIRLSIDPEEVGELPDAPELVERFTALVKDTIGVTPSKGPRVAGLKAMGLQPDEWCQSSPGRVSVQIHGGE